MVELVCLNRADVFCPFRKRLHRGDLFSDAKFARIIYPTLMKNAVIWDNITESENGGQKVDSPGKNTLGLDGPVVWEKLISIQ